MRNDGDCILARHARCNSCSMVPRTGMRQRRCRRSLGPRKSKRTTALHNALEIFRPFLGEQLPLFRPDSRPQLRLYQLRRGYLARIPLLRQIGTRGRIPVRIRTQLHRLQLFRHQSKPKRRQNHCYHHRNKHWKIPRPRGSSAICKRSGCRYAQARS